jgi:predicted amidohydrolase
MALCRRSHEPHSIAAIHPGKFTAPANVSVLDLQGDAVIPGLVNAHGQRWWRRRESNLSRIAGVRARRRNPERSEGPREPTV